MSLSVQNADIQQEVKMSVFFTPQTGDEQMDDAYARLKAHMESFEEFAKFFDYFNTIVKTDDDKYIKRWLLKVLFVQLKAKHPFDEIYDNADDEGKKIIKNWMERNLENMRNKT